MASRRAIAVSWARAMNRIVLLGIGGLLGTLARYGVNGTVSNHQARAWTTWATFPLGTMIVNVSQLVVVESDKQYDLEGFLKTSRLESAGTPVVEIVDAADGSVLGTSQPAPAGDNDWQPVTITFKTGAKTEAIGIRVSRAPCGDNPSCPIFGTLWYDDFNLKRRS